MWDSCGPFLFTFDCSGPQRLLTPCTEASTLLGCTKICSVQHRGFWCLHKGLYILLNYSEMHRVLLMSTQRPWWSPRCPHLHKGPFKSIQKPLLTDQLYWSLPRSTQKLMDLRGLDWWIPNVISGDMSRSQCTWSINKSLFVALSGPQFKWGTQGVTGMCVDLRRPEQVWGSPKASVWIWVDLKRPK